MGKPSIPTPPAAPDPSTVINTQAEVNRINEVNPFSSLTYSRNDRAQADRDLQNGFIPTTPNGFNFSGGGGYGGYGGYGGGPAGYSGGANNYVDSNGNPTGAEYTRTLQLAPEIQALLDSQIGVSQSSLDRAGSMQEFLPDTPINTSGIALPGTFQGTEAAGVLDPSQLTDTGVLDINSLTGINDVNYFSDASQAVERSVFDRGSALLNEQFDRREDKTRSRLANQGLPVGGEAYDDDYRLNVTEPFREASTALALDSVMAGRSEGRANIQTQLATRASELQAQAQKNGQQLSRREAERAAQQQYFNQTTANRSTTMNESNTMFAQETANRNARIQSLLQDRTQPFNEIQALLGQQQVAPPTSAAGQGFMPPAPIDVTGAFALPQQAFGNQLGAAQLSSSFGSSMLDGLFGLGAAGIMKCFVAREVYGIDDNRWKRFMVWKDFSAPSWLRGIYNKFGEVFARWIHNKPFVKWTIRKLMDLVVLRRIAHGS